MFDHRKASGHRKAIERFRENLDLASPLSLDHFDVVVGSIREDGELDVVLAELYLMITITAVAMAMLRDRTLPAWRLEPWNQRVRQTREMVDLIRLLS